MPNYNFEALGPDRFQQLVQALVVDSFPNVQCLPLNQADGGRDAISRETLESVVVFQAKHRSIQEDANRGRAWLLKELRAELRNIERLRKRGMARYVVATNVPGSGLLDFGSIDKASVLGAAVSMEVWWRDDIARRLDSRFELCYRYPELLSGSDVLAILAHDRISDHQHKTIRAALRSDLERDRHLRFRQTELRGDIFSLFIDPACVTVHPPPRRKHSQGTINARPLSGWDADDPTTSLAYGAGVDPYPQRFVLQGAPGQGKSTIAQYVAQVHRARLLDSHADVVRLREDDKHAPLRIPLKIELRDLASALDATDPPTLEEYLALALSRSSGGLSVDANDIVRLVEHEPSILILDGFDEVADLRLRREIVSEVTAGVGRLEENAVDLVTMITSRPAAFANSPGFDSDHFPVWMVDDLDDKLAIQYAEKWALAYNVPEFDIAPLIDQLRQRIREPHIRDLARNPMQLTILLSLMNARGASLPDQRTTLYGRYLDMFLTREAEKSVTIREHRRLIEALHHYLGWYLHADAELGGAGRIALDDLRDLIQQYLIKESYDRELAEELLAGTVDRVMALVSRQEGAFEFEVQPLREYFAARHLYTTAPPSRVGETLDDSRSDRFAVIGVNGFWLDVARFFAGSYEKGELGTLALQLMDWIDDYPREHARHAAQLAWLLLNDQVFAQNRNVAAMLVARLLSVSDGRLVLLTDWTLSGGRSPFTFPAGSGQSHVADYAYECLAHSAKPDRDGLMAALLVANSSPERCQEVVRSLGENVSDSGGATRWALMARAMGHLGEDLDRGYDLLRQAPPGLATSVMLETLSPSTWSQHAGLVDLFRRAVADDVVLPTYYFDKRSESAEVMSLEWTFDLFGVLVSSEVLIGADGTGGRTTAWRVAPGAPECFDERLAVIASERKRLVRWPKSMRVARLEMLWESVDEYASKSFLQARIGLEALLHVGRSALPQNDVGETLALMDRHRRNPAWWSSTLRDLRTEFDIRLAVVGLFSIGSGPTIRHCIEVVEPLIASLSWDLKDRIARDVWRIASHYSRRSAPLRLNDGDLWQVEEPTVRLLLSIRGPAAMWGTALDRVSPDRCDSGFMQRELMTFVLAMLGDSNRADHALAMSASLYAAALADPYRYYSLFEVQRTGTRLRLDAAERILIEVDRYPLWLVESADRTIASSTARPVRAVSQVARESGWDGVNM